MAEYPWLWRMPEALAKEWVIPHVLPWLGSGQNDRIAELAKPFL
jgi:hypothetical protein